MKVLNLLHFCKTKQGEIGIADGYFAGDAWKDGDESFAQVSGKKFGWIDSEGKEYCDISGRVVERTGGQRTASR